MCERCKELFDLRVTFLLAPRVVEQCRSSADQRNNQNTAFPKQHLIVTMKLDRAFETRLIDQIELAQTKHQPPAGQRDCKHNPQPDEYDDNPIALSFHATGVQSTDFNRPFATQEKAQLKLVL